MSSILRRTRCRTGTSCLGNSGSTQREERAADYGENTHNTISVPVSSCRKIQFQAFSLDYVQRLMDGDPETQQHFISYLSNFLLIKLGRRLRPYQPIEDVRQETFLRVFSALKRRTLAAPERLGAFVNGICNNVLSEYYRSSIRQAPRLEGDNDMLGSDPGQELEAIEKRQCVRDVLNSLPSKDREILRLIFIEEKNKDEVCQICCVDRAYLRVLIHRAKNRFRKVSRRKPRHRDPL